MFDAMIYKQNYSGELDSSTDIYIFYESDASFMEA
jgi:hypothetical protein